ncbi:MAG: hypothetical protein IAE89_11035 [Anaerolineae bacterium]|nr:hypothetical protein [Anaerolineae bacterium]
MAEIDYQTLNERVDKSLRKRKMVVRGVFFGLSVFMFILFTALALSAFAGDPLLPSRGFETSQDAAVFMLITGWLCTLIFYGLGTLFDSGIFDKSMRAQIVSQQMGMAMVERMDAAMVEKPKREEASEADIVELTDDGELKRMERKG